MESFAGDGELPRDSGSVQLAARSRPVRGRETPANCRIEGVGPREVLLRRRFLEPETQDILRLCDRDASLRTRVAHSNCLDCFGANASATS